MPNAYQNISHHLNTRKATFVCFTIAFASRLIVLLYHFSLSGDRALQAVAAKNLSEGSGFTINNVLEDNIFQQIYTPLLGWPPGYSILLSIPFVLTNNMLLSIVLIDALSVFMLLYFSRKILSTVGCSVALINLYTLMQGFFLYDFTTGSYSDLNALGFLVASISIFLAILNDKSKPLYYGVILAVLNFFVPFMRYMYISTIFILPSYLYFWSKETSNRRVFHIAALSLCCTGLLLFGLLAFQKAYTGSATHVYPFPVGYFPENLLRLHPFALNSFFDIGFYSTIADKLGVAEYGKLNFLFFSVSCCILLFLGVQLIRFYFKRKDEASGVREHYVYVGSLYCIIILALLVALSLRYGGTAQHNYWTYVQEGRYWCFATFFLQQLVFIFIFHNWKNLRKKRWRIIGGSLCVVLFLEAAHGLYFNTKTALRGINFVQNGERGISYYGPMKQLAERAHAIYPNTPVVFVSDVNNYLNPLRLMNEKTIQRTLPFDSAFRKDGNNVTVFIIKKSNSAFLSSVQRTPSVVSVFQDDKVQIFSTHPL